MDLARGLVNIHATLTEDENGAMIATSPKTDSSFRTIKLTKSNIAILRQHQKAHLTSKQGLSTWVFPNPEGGRKVVTAAKVPGLTFHGLRHTHATMLAAAGVPARSVMDRLGHSKSRMTLEVYSDATVAMQDQAVAALDILHERIDSQIDSQAAKEESVETSNALFDAR